MSTRPEAPSAEDGFVSVRIHENQTPDRLRDGLVQSLQSRRLANKFHYDSPKQAARWLALHQAFSPSRTDPECAAVYDRAYAQAADGDCMGSGRIHLIGLGAGGGQKDTRLLRLLRERAADVTYWPVDSSASLVLVARQTALAVIAADQCHPLVCDFEATKDLPAFFDGVIPPGQPRLITFFGMLPNFEPDCILPGVAALVRPGDQLLLSANLVPGPDYAAGIRQVLPQYDNPLTREWLLTLPSDLGIEAEDGELRFSVEPCPRTPGLLRIEAGLHFVRRVAVAVEAQRIGFEVGERLRLFYSYRYTPGLLREVFGPRTLRETGSWVSASGEEGVFGFRRVD